MDSKLYSVKEAAEKLGVTENTIRNRIKRGILTAERVPRAGGFAWRVELPEEELPGGGRVVEPASPTIQALLGLLRERDAEIQRLQEERVRLNSQVAQLTGVAATYQELAGGFSVLSKSSWTPPKAGAGGIGYGEGNSGPV